MSIPRNSARRPVAVPQRNRQQILRLQAKPTNGLILPRLLLGGLVVYILSLGAFSFVHYDEDNPRPAGVERVPERSRTRSFRGWIG